MNSAMAESAVLVFGVGEGVGGGGDLNAVILAAEGGGAVVAFKANREDLGTLEQSGIH